MNVELPPPLDQVAALCEQGRVAEAEAICRRVLQDAPRHGEALQLLGLIALQRGDANEAARLIGEAVAAAPQEARYRINLSAVLGQAGRSDEALATARQVVASHPDHPEAHNNLGSALVRLGHCEEALACYDRAIGLRPDYDEALYNRGIALQSLGRHEAAAASYRQAIALQPDYVEAYNNLGIALAALDRCEEALASYDEAIALDPEYDEAFYNRGVALQALERHLAALASYDQAIALRPDYADALKNRGMVRQAIDRHDAALADYAASLALRPDHAATHFSRSLCLLQSGDLPGGWREYEWRWRMPQFQPGLRDFDQPLWTGGEPLAGRTILLHAEQGMGDTLQFCRYAAAVAARGATVVLEVPAPLARLLAGLAGVTRIVARGEPLPPFDLHCPLMSLPLALGTTLQTIPAAPGYLAADPVEVAAWRATARGGTGHACRPGLGRCRRTWPRTACAPCRRRRLRRSPRYRGSAWYRCRRATPRPGSARHSRCTTSPTNCTTSPTRRRWSPTWTSSSASARRWRISPGGWAGRSGCRCTSMPAGAGCAVARTAHGIRRRGCSVRPPPATGTASSRALPQRCGITRAAGPRPARPPPPNPLPQGEGENKAKATPPPLAGGG